GGVRKRQGETTRASATTRTTGPRGQEQGFPAPRARTQPVVPRGDNAARGAGNGVVGSFDNEIFKSRYQRNNKRGGLKNLRCFPSCGFRHKERGFCGRSVEVEVRHPAGVHTENFMCWAEFVKKGDPQPYTVGQTVLRRKMETQERTKDDPVLPLVRGDRLGDKCTDTISAFEFNKERRGWHYGWASNKHTCNAEHVLQCYVFETNLRNPSELVCRAIFQSPSFMLFCRRRRRFTIAPSAPAAVPLKRARSMEQEAAAVEGGAVAIKREPNGADSGLDVTAEGVKRFKTGSQQQATGGSFTPLSQDSVSPATRRRNFSSGDGDLDRMENIFRRLQVIMGRIRQQEPRRQRRPRRGSTLGSTTAAREPASSSSSSSSAASVASWGNGSLPLSQVGDDDFGSGSGLTPSFLDAFEIFQTMPDLTEDSVPLDDPLPLSEGTAGGGGDFGMPLGGDFSFSGSLESPMPEGFREDRDGSSSSSPKNDGNTEGVAKGDIVPAPQTLRRSTSDQMIDDVAQYLSHESGFQRAVEQLARQTHNGAPPNYHGFLRIVKNYLESYRRSRNISRAEFDRVFNKATNAQQTLMPVDLGPRGGDGDGVGDFDGGKEKGATSRHGAPSTSLSHPGYPASASAPDAARGAPAAGDVSRSRSILGSALGAFTSLVSSSSSSSASPAIPQAPTTSDGMYIIGPHNTLIPNVPGRWRQTEESEMLMQEMRFKMGTPWILSKMFEFMESRFEIEVHGLDMITRLNRKWISNTTLRFHLDGEEHHWGITLPAPFSQLSQGWTYRAWIEDNKIILSHMIGDQRLTRFNWLSKDRSILHSIVTLEVQDSVTGTYQEMAHQLLQPTECMRAAVFVAVLTVVAAVWAEPWLAAWTADMSAFRERVQAGGRSALVIGATGATGSFVVQELLERPEWERVVVLSRRELQGVQHDKLEVVVMDLQKDEVDAERLKGLTNLFNCIGTTRALAGGADGFHAIEVGISTKVAKAAKEAGIQHASVISAQGASPKRSIAPKWFHPLFYGKTMGLKEQTLIDNGFPRVTIFRPGMLKRGNAGSDTRTMEKVFGSILPSLDVKLLAKAMVNDAESGPIDAPEQPLYVSGNGGGNEENGEALTCRRADVSPVSVGDAARKDGAAWRGRAEARQEEARLAAALAVEREKARRRASLRSSGRLRCAAQMWEGKKADQVAVLAMGSSSSDNVEFHEYGGCEHVVQHVKMGRPTAEVLKSFKNDEMVSKTSDEGKAPLGYGVKVAVEEIRQQLGTKNYNRRVVVFTSGRGLDFAGLEQVLKENSALVKVEVVVVATDGDESAVSVAELSKLIEAAPKEGGHEVLNDVEMASRIRMDHVGTMSQIPAYRGVLRLWEKEAFHVNVFTKTAEAKPPSLKKASKIALSDENRGDKDGAKAQRQIWSTLPDKPDEEVPPEEQANGYRYGRQFVPMSAQDEEAKKYAADKDMSVVGFVDASAVPMHLNMGKVLYVEPQPGLPNSKVGFSALVRALLARDMVAIARFVPRKSGAMTLNALIPHVSEDDSVECMYTWELPFDQDVREHIFSSLANESMQPSSEQMEAMDELVAAFDIGGGAKNEVTGITNAVEQFVPEKTLNPLLERLHRLLHFRMIDENSALPQDSEEIEALFKPNAELLARCKPQFDKVSAAFSLKREVAAVAAPESAAAPDPKRARVGLVADGVVAGSSSSSSSSSGADNTGSSGANGASVSNATSSSWLGGGDKIDAVGSVNPVSDFESMLERTDKDVSEAAFDGMKKQIEQLMAPGVAALYFPKAVECLVSLRKGALRVSMENEFNKFLRAVKQDAPGELWKLIVGAELTLISSDDAAVVSDVSAADAAAFLKDAVVAKAVAVEAVKAVAVENDDDFDDFE
ncbi:X-ray repair cross-complementing protein 5 (ATP-dependent DNA helicase 2 subunit ku80), partial [Durusdinium trenchii]